MYAAHNHVNAYDHPSNNDDMVPTGPPLGNKSPIAIVGMSCRFPGDATDPKNLWTLCAEGRSAWSEIPQDRFNQKAFYHPVSDRPGTSHVRGGHFLKEDVACFDAAFFSFSSDVSSCMDPQVRLQLESTYEALESAGIPISQIAGTQTSVFAGAIFRDYHDSLLRDPDILPRYHMTGNGAAMISNRISHFFDLRGPSVTVDTGCSTGLTALHLGCQSIRAGESVTSIIGGSNVIINPDMFISMSGLGFLGADGKSYTFDANAQGYGRGEGVATIILKSLDDALRDGDPVRAVIRETALNQDGKTPTITSPSGDAQADLIRTCYKRVGLDPLYTSYVEAHGTGTRTGDPAEAEAIGSVFGERRPSGDSLFIGSIKSNIGHLEAASGLAAVIKVALAFENGAIPPSIHSEHPNPWIDFDKWNLKLPRKLEPWPSNQLRRASINNFGYGGTNTHVIMDDPMYHQGKPVQRKEDNLLRSNADDLSDTDSLESEAWRVFMLSAKDEVAANAMVANLRDYLKSTSHQSDAMINRDLAYTLGQRRSVFPWVAATPARGLSDLLETIELGHFTSSHISKRPQLGFVFNGQGAQWHAMARELITAYPVFRKSIIMADRFLKEFGASWSLLEELLRDAETSRVNEPIMSLPLCMAVQISLVKLLRSWGARPTAVTGHSSGEVAAAYAAGAIGFRNALALVYFRGVLTTNALKKSPIRGSMLAVGLGAADIEPYLQRLTSGKVIVACVNSLSSVTLSGDLQAIEQVETLLNQENVFTRKLKVDTAYHSHHMDPIAKDYGNSIQQHISDNSSFGHVCYFSPVTGGQIGSAEELTAEHWVKNMVQPVLFAQSFRNMCIEKTTPHNVLDRSVDTIIEIGPHSALAGPIRQILALPELNGCGISYGTCLSRGRNAVLTMQTLACLLITKGYPLDMKAVNFPKDARGVTVIHNLPSYPWNHSVRHWVEPRLNREYRHREHAPRDLLGTRIHGNNPSEPTWRHFIRASDIPWVRDHQVQSDIVYPGAGCVAMAIEAAHQLAQCSERSVSGYSLRDIEMMKALVIPDTAAGVEVQISLRACGDKSLDQFWQYFNIYSISNNDTWNQHCKGLICPRYNAVGDVAPSWSSPKAKPDQIFTLDANSGVYTQRRDPRDYFKSLQALGILHGPSFQNLLSIRSRHGQSVATFSVADAASVMPGKFQHSHVLHPTTLDSTFQAAYSVLSRTQARGFGAAIPRFIKTMYISTGISSVPGHRFQTFSTLESRSSQGFEVSIATINEGQIQSSPVLKLEGLYYQSLGSSLTLEENTGESNRCLTIQWERDISLMRAECLKASLIAHADSFQIELINDLRRATYHFIHDTLATLTDDDLNSLDWHHERLVKWMKLQAQRGTQNELAPNSSRWAKSSPGVKQLLFDNVSHQSVNGMMLCRLGRQLVPILRKEVVPLELMLEDKLLYRYYENALRVDRSLGQVKQLVELFTHHNPRAQVLEIGAGTGACTGPVLRSLGGGDSGESCRFAHYDFTDISPGFFEAAREKFGAWGDLISYTKLDIEQDLSEQLLELGSYDLVIACQVLHATKAIENTMTNVRRLMKPGGKLIMVETTQDAFDVQLVFGTLPGWWLGEDEERKHSPNLSADRWEKVLARTGFSGLDVEVRDCDDNTNYAMSVMMATAVTPETSDFHSQIAIVHAGPLPPLSWLEHLRESLAEHLPVTATIEGLHSLQPDGKDVIFVGEIEHSILESMESAMFSKISNLLNLAKGVLWVSRGGTMACERPEAALHTGLLRTLRLENVGKKYVTLDLDARQDPWTATSVNTIIKVFLSVFSRSMDKVRNDFEYAERGSDIYVPRVYEDAYQNSLVASVENVSAPEMQPFYQPGRELRMDIENPGLLDTLMFKDDPSAGNPLPDDFVEIEPRAFGLNFRDVMVAMGQLQETTMGFECSGIVNRVGPNTSSFFRPGDRVCALTTSGHWANLVRVHWTGIGHIPEDLTFEEAASIPMVFITAYYAISESARLQKGETILIHAATGGVGQAAIMLSQHIGAEIFVTVGSQEKRDFIVKAYGIEQDHIFSSRDTSFARNIMTATNGRGVDVVLNSLKGQLLQESWNCVATLGRFIEIGKRDIQSNMNLGMERFGRAISFSAVDLIHLGNFNGQVMHRVMQTVLALLRARVLKLVTPLTVYPISEIQKAFRLMQAGKHLGKIIIQPSHKDLVRVIPRQVPTKLSSKNSYVLVGGFGGIGKSIAQWLVQQGARSLVLLSRSAGTQSNSNPFLEDLRATGCTVTACDCNIADMGELAMIMTKITQHLPPVRGVIQAAMVLSDSVFENMSFAQWQAAIYPKVQGSRNLHNYFKNLDFFVMLSSATGVLGNTSQANYASGGTFQDALARHRSANKLPAVSIDLGMVKSVGYVAENAGVAERLTRIGYRPLEEDEVLSIIAAAVQSPLRELHASQVVTGLAPFSQAHDIRWRQEPRFQGLKINTLSYSHANSGSHSDNKDGTISVSASLASCASVNEVVAVVTGAIISKLAEMFMISEAQIDKTKPMSDYGVDSLVAVELRNWLIARVQAEVSIFDVLQSSSLANLAEKVAAKRDFVI